MKLGKTYALGVVAVGADTAALEVIPFESKTEAFPVHQIFLTRNGIHILENIRLDHLAADKVFKFAFVMAPLPMKGATGSPAAPIAVA